MKVINKIKNFLIKVKRFFISLWYIPYKELTFKQTIIWIIASLSERAHFLFDGKEKRKYSKLGSKKAAKSMAKKHNKIFDYYLCIKCGSWHIGKRNF
jgi:hypothetical protein